MEPPRILHVIPDDLIAKHPWLASQYYQGISERDLNMLIYKTEHLGERDFFTDTITGERRVYEPGVMDSNQIQLHAKMLTEYHANMSTQILAEDDKIHVHDEPSMAIIDTPMANDVYHLTRHHSELVGSGWNLPVDHCRHILNFPAEILRMILQCLLTLDKGETITPEIIRGTSKRIYAGCKATYKTSHHAQYSTQYIYSQRYDNDGEYLEIQALLGRLSIDATCLRACRIFYEIGSPVLYGLNTFKFKMANVHGLNAPAFLVEPSSGILLHPNPNKPGRDRLLGEVKEAIKQIEYRRPLRMLSGWVYYDPFLRFLHAIGPRNASLITHLAFTGVAKLHTCEFGPHVPLPGCFLCSDDLIRSGRFYTNFITKFCSRLFQLTLIPKKDWTALDFPTNPHDLPDWQAKTMEDAVTKLLRESISRIKTLRRLNVLELDWDWSNPSFRTDHIDNLIYGMRPMDFAKPVIPEVLSEIFRSAATTSRPNRSGQVTHYKGKKRKGCGFCGENHPSHECFNLCSACGDYGHFKQTCPNWTKLYGDIPRGRQPMQRL
ncbi:hypothetical protein HYFRA_00004274 [Hymenoscyphus fraxineus]|uniref:CCHC-type domain-containing protein n=1 Tax=Hymenoscyphus fraxineus TaxID=746836 RepID=A0A9N9PNR1_9HELO|nr:hypothetical protein HYFRA_00004274 [Hymenoscyphus fraxineus]